MAGKKFRLSLKAIAWECSAIIFAIPLLVLIIFLGIVAFRVLGGERLGPASFVLPLIFVIVQSVGK